MMCRTRILTSGLSRHGSVSHCLISNVTLGSLPHAKCYREAVRPLMYLNGWHHEDEDCAARELANAIRVRYGAATGNAKRKILDEFIAHLAITKSRSESSMGRSHRQERQTRKRPSL